jgi:guanylate kinase
LASSTGRAGGAASRVLPVIVVTGTSGAGKGTLERAVMPRLPELELAISATTRERRAGEREGREYYFIDDDEFQRLLDAGEFLEHVDFEWGQRVGTLWSEITRIRAAARAPLLDLETDGALAVQREIAESVTIFVKAPTS